MSFGNDTPRRLQGFNKYMGENGKYFEGYVLADEDNFMVEPCPRFLRGETKLCPRRWRVKYKNGKNEMYGGQAIVYSEKFVKNFSSEFPGLKFIRVYAYNDDVYPNRPISEYDVSVYNVHIRNVNDYKTVNNNQNKKNDDQKNNKNTQKSGGGGIFDMTDEEWFYYGH